MNLNIKIGKAFGTPIVLTQNWFIFVTIILFFQSITGLSAFFNAALLIVALSFAVLLHELGHVRVAKHFGARTDVITLNMFGGLARISPHGWITLFRKPYKSMLVWLAGPAVSVALSVVSLGLATLFAHLLLPSFASRVFYFSKINMIIALFNLLPIFPLDGGGILYSALCMFMPRAKAINIVSMVGMVGSIVLALVAIKYKAIMLIIISVMIFMSAREAPKNPLYSQNL
jgi:Zn-dependent protease